MSESPIPETSLADLDVDSPLTSDGRSALDSEQTRTTRVAIAGAGNVGRSIALELIENNHDVLLIEREMSALKQSSVPGALWVHGDACEVATLEQARLQDFDVMVAATGDDKVNLVVSLLAKTEFGVRRVVARVNHPKNEWLYNESWGVDVAVSTPRMLTALVEEAVSVGDLVRLMSFMQGEASLVEVTLADDSPLAGRRIDEVDLPPDTALVTILRGGHVVLPSPEATLEAGDEVLAVATTPEVEAERADVLGGGQVRDSSPNAAGSDTAAGDIAGSGGVL
jgi:trk system potassium uptake protein TrkA